MIAFPFCYYFGPNLGAGTAEPISLFLSHFPALSWLPIIEFSFFHALDFSCFEDEIVCESERVSLLFHLFLITSGLILLFSPWLPLIIPWLMSSPFLRALPLNLIAFLTTAHPIYLCLFLSVGWSEKTRECARWRDAENHLSRQKDGKKRRRRAREDKRPIFLATPCLPSPSSPVASHGEKRWGRKGPRGPKLGERNKSAARKYITEGITALRTKEIALRRQRKILVFKEKSLKG